MDLRTPDTVKIGDIVVHEWLFGNATALVLTMPKERVYLNIIRGFDPDPEKLRIVLFDECNLLPEKLELGGVEYIKLSTLLTRKATDGKV